MTDITNIQIRVQALGGMFLGPDSYNGGIVSVFDQASGHLLSHGFTDNGDSGTRVDKSEPGVSPFPIETPSPVNAEHWVLPGAKTVGYVAALELLKDTDLKVEAKIPLPPAQADKLVAGQLPFKPGQPNSHYPGLVLVVPGLWIQPEFAISGNTVKLKTKVTMMCGCEINRGSPWIPSDFEVSVLLKGSSQVEVVNLTFLVNSQFVAERQLPAGHYEAAIEAKQYSVPQNHSQASMSFEIR